MPNPTELIDAHKAIQTAGAEKTVDGNRRNTFIDIFKKHDVSPMVSINADVKALSRTVMRYPGKEALEILYAVHKSLQILFAGQHEKGLEWLLAGTGMARGGFSKPQTFIDFLNKNPESIPTSRLITGLESALTNIGYRMVSLNPMSPFKKDIKGPNFGTPEQIQVQEVIEQIAMAGGKNQVVAYVGETYINRATDDVNTKVKEATDITIEPVDVSEASEADPEDRMPKEKPITRVFQRENDPGNFSWIGAAVKSNIPVRAHASGSASLTLGCMMGVLEIISEQTKELNVIKSDDDIRTVAAVLVIPTYERGDYHTVAETYAGVEHYISARNGRPGTPLQPYEAFESGLVLMAKASSDSKKVLLKGKEISLKMPINKAMMMVSNDLCVRIEKHDAQFAKQTRSDRSLKT